MEFLPGTVKKYIKNFGEIRSSRGLRYFGPSKMSLLNLIIFSIIAVFKNQVLLRTSLSILILIYLNFTFGINLIFFKLILLMFCLVIFVVSLERTRMN